MDYASKASGFTHTTHSSTSSISMTYGDHPDAYKWIEANGQWLYNNFDPYEVETSDDDDDARSLWSLDDDEYFDPFEDDPTHPDAR
nr:hypothetical protein [Tanacetum cinerariifolium]